MPPVMANGGYYGAPGVTAAGAYGSTPADMLHSLRNNGWSDQQIMNVYGANDPMVRIMQLENRWNQTQPGAGGYRYQYPTRATTPARRPSMAAQNQQRAAAPARQPATPARQPATPARQPAAQPAAQPAQLATKPAAQPAAQPAAPLPGYDGVSPDFRQQVDEMAGRMAQEMAREWEQKQAQQGAPIGSYGASPLAARMARQRAANTPPPLNPVQRLSLESAVAEPFQSLPDFGSFAPSYTSNADDYYTPVLGNGIRIRPWTNSLSYGGSLNMPPMQEEPSFIDSLPEHGSLFINPFSGSRSTPEFSTTNLGQSVYNSLAQYR